MDNSEYLILAGLIVSLITAGLIPYLISRNTQQHLSGTADRAAQKTQLDLLLGNQHDISSKIDVIKADVSDIKDTRIRDKEAFFTLYEKVVEHASQHQRDSSIMDTHRDSSPDSSYDNPVALITPSEFNR